MKIEIIETVKHGPDIQCSICKRVSSPVIYLPLFCNGSEGISVCTTCRVTLTEIARLMMMTASLSNMEGMKKAYKKVEESLNNI